MHKKLLLGTNVIPYTVRIDGEIKVYIQSSNGLHLTTWDLG